MAVRLHPLPYVCIPQNLKSVMLKCLKTADSAGMTSISLPALGTGKLKYAPHRVAEIMYDVGLGFRSKGLNKIYIVVHSSSPDVQKVGHKIKLGIMFELISAPY